MARNAYEAGLSHFPDTPTLGVYATDAIAAAPIPGAAVVSTGLHILQDVRGGNATDAARQQRVTWTLQQAQQGSPTAAAIIVAAPVNVGANEASMWRSALAQIPDVVLSAADAKYPGGYWPVGQPDFYTDTSGQTHRTIVSEVANANRVGLAVGGAISSGVAAVTRNPSTSLLGLAAIGGLAYVLMRKR